MNNAWSWKVKESELFQKNVSLLLAIPLMVQPWGNFLMRIVPEVFRGIAIVLEFDREL